MLSLKNLKLELQKLTNPHKVLTLQRFFKTGKGDYGEGDQFLGIAVPLTRNLIKSYTHLKFKDLKILLNSKLHEERLCALLILVHQYKKAETKEAKKNICQFYLEHTHRINNWDLVDLTAPHIVGHYLFDQEQTVIQKCRGDNSRAVPAKVLYNLAQSTSLWERRIAIVATHYFIRQKIYAPTLTLAAMLLSDQEDLMHKACGWMLRELGKRDLKTLEFFLKKHSLKMPRTMLRYAIEKFPEEKRKKFLIRNS